MRNRHLFSFFFVSIAAAFLGSLLLACSSSVGSYCETLRNCEGGTDDTQNACVKQQDGLRDIARTKGCPNAYDDYLSCISSNAKCENKQIALPPECQKQYDAVKSCGVVL